MKNWREFKLLSLMQGVWFWATLMAANFLLLIFEVWQGCRLGAAIAALLVIFCEISYRQLRHKK
jgi:hypothetical protein